MRLAGALETAHRAGVLHRDVKPANVLLTDYGEPQLSDFGIARIAGSRETAPDVVVGSPSYTAPELFEGRPASIAADVYGLAATVFTLLNGDPPFPFRSGENPIAFVRRVTAGPIPDLRAKGVPDPICSALEHGLNIDPARRPSSAAAFGEMLRTAATQVGLNIADVPLQLPPPPTDGDESELRHENSRFSGAFARLSDCGRTGQPRSGERTIRPAHQHDSDRRHSLVRRCRGDESSTASARGQDQSWSSSTRPPATAKAPWPRSGPKHLPDRV